MWIVFSSFSGGEPSDTDEITGTSDGMIRVELVKLVEIVNLLSQLNKWS